MQWLKRYFDLNYNGEEYDAVGKRKGQDFYYIGGGAQKAGIAKPSGGMKKPTAPKTAPTATSKPKPTVVGIKKTDGAGKQNEEL